MKIRKHKTRSKLLIEELEPRILFSADGLSGGPPLADRTDEAEHVRVLESSDLAGIGVANRPELDNQSAAIDAFAMSTTEPWAKRESVSTASSNPTTKAASRLATPQFIETGPYFVDEGAIASTVVGDVDARNGLLPLDDSVFYSITNNVNPDGDSNDAFAIDFFSGVITVNDTDDLDFENNDSFVITVNASDGFLSNTADITININDVKPTLTASGSGLIHVGGEYPLDLTALEPGTNSITSYTVNWGDGTVTTEAYTGTTTSVTHVYANVGITYDITYTANEASGSLTTSDLVVSNYVGGTDDVFRFDGDSGNLDLQFASSGGDLNRPYGLTVGPDGNVYVAGYESDSIVSYSVDGTYLGVFTSHSQLDYPTSVSWGADGNLYVTNSEADNILRFASDGSFIDVWASGGALDAPEDLAFSPDGDLYVASWSNRSIVVIDGSTGGAATTVLDSSDGLSNPEQIQFGENGDLFIANADNAEVLRWDGTTVSSYFSHAQLTHASGIAFGPDGALYVSSNSNDRILRFDGVSGEVFSDNSSGGLSSPAFLAFTPANQVLVVANTAPTASNLNSASPYNEDAGSVAITDIVVSDADTPEIITATLTLANTTTGSLSANDGATYSSGTGIWTITDTLANVNTALANLVFIPAENNDLDTSISVSIDDGDEDSSAALTGSIGLDATPVNDAPTATRLNASEAYTEDTPLNLKNIVVSDIDDSNTTVTLTLSDPAAGSLSTATSNGVTSNYDVSSGVWSATGAISDVNTLLAGVTFNPALHYNNNFSIATSVSDGKASPVVGNKSFIATAVNDLPKATNLNASETYTEDQALNLVDIVVSDVDHTTTTVKLALSDTAAGALSTATSGSVSSTYNASSGIWTATGAIADVNSLLADVTFNPTQNYDKDFSINTSVSDGQSGGPVGVKTFTANPVNDAPTATNLSAPEAYMEDTPLNLTDIVISDIDNSTTTATLTLSETAAGSLSTGTSGSVSSTFDAGTGVWVASGAIADVNALLSLTVFTPALDYNSNFTITSTVDDGVAPPSFGSKNFTATADNDSWYFWLATLDVSSPSGAPGLDSWSDSTFLEFREPNFTLGENVTDGTFSAAFNLGSFASSTTRIDAIHHVATDLSLGGNNFPAIDVKVGDVIFSTGYSVTLSSNNSVAVSDEDVVLFSPTVPGDYSSGMFTILLEDINGNGDDIDGITLVERDTTLADGTVLEQGDFLYSSNNTDHKLFWFLTEDVGIGNTAGTVRELLDGDDVGVNIAAKIRGIDLVENGTSLAGVDLNSGQILLSTDASITGGSNNQAFTRNDIVVLTIPQTTWAGGAGNGSASVSVLLDGSDVGLDSGDERVGGLSLVSTNSGGGNSAPVATNLNSAETYTEDTILNLTDIVVSDVDHTTTSVTLTLSDTAAGFLSTGTSGGVTSTFRSGSGIWSATGAITDVNALLQNLSFIPSTNYNSDFVINVTVSDGVAAPVTGSKILSGLAANDSPTATNLNSVSAYTEDQGVVEIADIVVSDIDVGETITATLVLADTSAGVLSTNDGAVYNNGTGTWEITGTVANVNSALANLEFTAAANNDLDTIISVRIDDGDEDSSGPLTGTITLDATSVNDAPTATNMNVAENFIEDTALNLVDIVVTDIDSANIAVSLTLSDAAAGSLSTATSGTVTSSYNAVSGVWTASGAIAEVNNLLASVTFNPNQDYSRDFSIVTAVSDGESVPINGTKVFTATAVNDAPSANAGGAYESAEGEGLVFDGSGSTDIDGVINRYEWLIDGNTISESSEANTAIDWQTLNSAGIVDDGIYDLALRTTDDMGAVDVDQFQLTINNTPPVLSVTGASSVLPGTVYNLNLSVTDPGNDSITSWTIDWGDGTVETLLGNPDSAEHTYLAPESDYIISVIVSDEDGSYAADDVFVTVLANDPPSVTLSDMTASLVENIDTSERIFLADIIVEDDGVGSNVITLAGENSELFEVEGNALYLKAGVKLDFDNNRQLEVNILVNDATVGSDPDSSVSFVLTVEQGLFIGLEGLSGSIVNQSEVESAGQNSEQEQAVDNNDESSSTIEEDIADTSSVFERGILPGATRGSDVSPSVMNEINIDNFAVDPIIQRVLPEQVLAGLSTQAAEILSDEQLELLDLIQNPAVDALTLSSVLEAVDLMEGYSFVDNDTFIRGLNDVRQQMDSIDLDKQIVIGSTTVVSSSLSIGYILWLLRGSVILSALLSSLPAWRMIDPLPILHGALDNTENDEDDDSLQSIIESSEDEPITTDDETLQNAESD